MDQNLVKDPFGGLEGAQAPSDLKIDQGMKIAIMGKPKNGKSWFAATMPGASLIYDFDGRAISLQGKALNARIRTLRDTLEKPSVVLALEKDLSTLKYRKMKGEPVPQNYIFDTVTQLLPAIKNDYLKHNKDGRLIKLGNSCGVQIGISYDLINTQIRFIEYLLAEYAALGNVIFVFHERDEKDRAESTAKETKYTGQVTVEPQFISNILSLFNEVFRIQVNGKGEYSVTCRPSYEVTASTTLLLDSTELPDLTKMIQKHKERALAAGK